MYRHWQSAAPVSDVLDLDAVKLHLRVDQTADDDLITDLIQGAAALAEQYTGRALMEQSWTLTDTAAQWPLLLPRWPVQSVTSLIVDGVQQVTAGVLSSAYTLYSGDEACIDSDAGGAEVTAVYRAGYSSAAAVPLPIRQWMLLHIGQWYAYREATVISAGSLHPLPFVDSLLSPYRIRLLGL